MPPSKDEINSTIVNNLLQMAQHYCHCDPTEVETKIFKIYGKIEEAEVLIT